jgi:septin 7
MNEISQNKIKIYEFPDCDDDEEGKAQKLLKNRIPFAVVGSNYVIESGGERKRGRKYPWGLVESKSKNITVKPVYNENSLLAAPTCSL